MSGLISAVTSIFTGGEKAPPPPAIITQAPVKKDDTAVQEAARRQMEELRKKRGFASTFLTGASGVTGAVPGKQASLG